MAEQLGVRLHGEPIGTLSPVSGRRERISFTWGANRKPMEVALTESFGAINNPDSAAAAAFFGGYAMDGQQRLTLARRRGIAENDLFGLLREYGESIAGAITISPEGSVIERAPVYEPVDSISVIRRLRRAVADGDLGTDDSSRSMIPGFRPKLLLAQFDGEWFIPHGRAHSTHIIKPRPAGRPDEIVREYYGHELARSMGLATHQNELVGTGDDQYLVIERYDRIVNGPGQVQLIHQEDSAQALGLDWVDTNAKFQDPRDPTSPRRPSAYKIAELLASLDSDAEEEWLRRLTFTTLIGDNDAHAKNIGILHLPAGSRLTSMYDAVPNLHQEERIDWNLSMSINRKFNHQNINATDLIQEGESWGALAKGRAAAVVEAALADFRRALDSVDEPRGLPAAVRPQLEWNVTRLASGDQIGERPARFRRATSLQ